MLALLTIAAGGFISKYLFPLAINIFAPELNSLVDIVTNTL